MDAVNHDPSVLECQDDKGKILDSYKDGIGSDGGNEHLQTTCTPRSC